LLLVHARSAFRDEGIVVENNMPFSDGESVFIFNGELRGVRIRSEGRIGAEKIYNYIRRFDKGDKCAATAKAVDIIKKRSTYVRAMNLILSDGAQSCLSTNYSENTGYFQMHQKQDGGLHLVCSEPFAGDRGWTRIENNTTIAL
jgi:glutamine amidotransferase